MTNESGEPSARPGDRRSVRWLGLVWVAAALGAFACGARTDIPVKPEAPQLESKYLVEFIDQSTTDKVDLLFMIDNSSSMADKQEILEEAVPDLVRRLVVPSCVSAQGQLGATPDSPDSPCPAGFDREFAPVRDMHVGIITSSIGGHGAGTCSGKGTSLRDEQENDHGHLIATRPRFANVVSAGAQAPEPAGFLDWNPEARNGAQSPGAFTSAFQNMVIAASEFGCGYESQLEAVFRFLADPKPYERIETRSCSSANPNDCAFPTGIDDALLLQRRAFLRPDSLLAAVLISDENDCSIREKEQGFYAARVESLDLPRAAAACAANPNDPCCVSCISALPAGCKADPSCEANRGELPDELDAPNLRCFDQKRRFGLDFLYPTSRYVNALRQVRLCLSRDDLSTAPGDECPDGDGDGAPDVARNPIYSDLSATGTMIRDRSIVFIAGIVGVPWQDITARTAADPVRRDELHYLTASELRAAGVWAKILGEPSPGDGAPPVPPTNALMIESTSPRTGFDGQGIALAPPDSPPMANPVNGHEWQNLQVNDLMYACIFELPGPRDCKEMEKIMDSRPGCDCDDRTVSSLAPICQAESGEYGRKQRYAKAYPATRELQVLRDFGDNAIVGSICARNVKDPSQQDFGYRPATDAIVDRLREGLTDRCFHRALEPDPVTHTPPCIVIEARLPGESCDAARRRSPASGDALPLVRQRVEDRGLCDAPGRPACSALVLCEVAEAGPACHRQMEQPDVGWCYVDPAQNPEDDPEIVASCPPAQKRLVRFVDPVPVTEPNVHALVVCPAQR